MTESGQLETLFVRGHSQPETPCVGGVSWHSLKGLN